MSRIVKRPADPLKQEARPTSPGSDRKKTDITQNASKRRSAEDGSGSPTPMSKSHRRSSPVAARHLQREASSSIAHDLATARGIPPKQQRLARQSSATQSGDAQTPPKSRESTTATTAATSVAVERKSDGKVQGLSPSGGARGQAAPAQTSPPSVAEMAASEAAFQKFYSTIEGIWSKIPSPLAFTGLPLGNADEASQAQKAEPTTAKTTQPSSAADVNKYFSQAALRAIRDGNDTGPGVHDSFYVVPPGGGTVTYAGMLARERKHARSHSSLSEQSEDTEEKFVDAHETPQARISLSRIARKASSYRSPASNKTFEELEVENAELKELTDDLAHKMYNFEKESQNQFARMQQSMRLKAPQKGERNLESRVTALEKDNERLIKENEKLTGVVARYRERWESLKQSARGRREVGAPTGAS